MSHKCVLTIWLLFAKCLVSLCRYCQIAAYADQSCDLCSGKQTNTTCIVFILYSILELDCHLLIPLTVTSTCK